jgi:dynein heavy chain
MQKQTLEWVKSLQLIFRWFTHVLKLFADFFLKSKRGGHASVARPSESFFSSFSTLVYNQLLSLIISSKNDYLDLFLGKLSKIPRFSVRVNLVDTKNIEMDPPIQEIEEALLDGLDYIVHTMEFLPRLENIIYSPLGDVLLSMSSENLSSGSSENKREKESPIRVPTGEPGIKIYMDQKQYEESASTLKALLQQSLKNVQLFLKKYDEFLELFSEAKLKAINSFFTEDHSFEEYQEVYYDLVYARKSKDIVQLAHLLR